MTAATFHLTGDRAIEQNAQYRLTFTYPGNLIGANVRGQIRKELGGELVGEFRMAQPTYDADADKTTFVVGLDSRQTDKIAATPPGQFWKYDLRLRPSGLDNIMLLRGNVEVLQNVTEG
jgi:hypothetical protein